MKSKFYVLNHCRCNAESHLLQPRATAPAVHPKGPKAFLAAIPPLQLEPCLPLSHSPFDFQICTESFSWHDLCKKKIPVPRLPKIARLYVKPKHSIKDNASHSSFMVQLKLGILNLTTIFNCFKVTINPAVC